MWGIDASPNATRKAEAKAKDRGIAVKFLTIDAMDLGGLGRTFDTVIDCGLFHVFSDQGRERYVSNLASVRAQGSMLVILCFSDSQPGDWGQVYGSPSWSPLLRSIHLCRHLLAIDGLRFGP